MCLFIFAVLATFKIWVSTQAMHMQSRLNAAQKKAEQLKIASNQLLLRKTQLINRDVLHARALALGYQEPNQVLYVIQP